MIRERKQTGIHKAFGNLVSEVTNYHFHYFLFIRYKSSNQPHSKSRAFSHICSPTADPLFWASDLYSQMLSKISLNVLQMSHTELSPKSTQYLHDHRPCPSLLLPLYFFSWLTVFYPGRQVIFFTLPFLPPPTSSWSPSRSVAQSLGLFPRSLSAAPFWVALSWFLSWNITIDGCY